MQKCPSQQDGTGKYLRLTHEIYIIVNRYKTA